MQTPHPSTIHRRSVVRQPLAWIASLYPLVWIVGLAILIPSVATDATQQETWDALHSSTSFGWQSLLVHGVAGILLLLIAWMVFAARRGRGAPMAAIRWIAATGVIAGGISLIQWIVEESLVLGWFGSSPANAGDRWQFVSTIDGLKMLALAGFVLALAFAGHQPGRWERGTAIAAAVALVLSGIGYAFWIAPLMLMAALSLPLLLISVLLSAIIESRRGTNA